MNSRRLKQLRHEAAMLGGAAPVVALIVVRAFAPVQGPAGALASTTPDEPALTARFDPPELTSRQRTMLAYADSIRDETSESPFLAATERVELQIDQAMPESESLRFAQALRLTSVVGGATPVAIIDGKPRRVNDPLEFGWWVSSIDASTSTVTLSHKLYDDTVLKIEPKLP